MDKKIINICNYLDNILPNAKCELIYHNDFELLIAVILSAQTTDKKVNTVTPILFKNYPNPQELAKAKQKDVEQIIKILGLYKNKAKNIISCAEELVSKYDSKVPSNFDSLISLSGVGLKTANVVLGELFNYPVIGVDTHVERVAKRLNLARTNDKPYEVEKKLENKIPPQNRVKFHHQMIHFGRYYCLARNPKCANCELKTQCKYYQKINKLK